MFPLLSVSFAIVELLKPQDFVFDRELFLSHFIRVLFRSKVFGAFTVRPRLFLNIASITALVRYRKAPRTKTPAAWLLKNCLHWPVWLLSDDEDNWCCGQWRLWGPITSPTHDGFMDGYECKQKISNDLIVVSCELFVSSVSWSLFIVVWKSTDPWR